MDYDFNLDSMTIGEYIDLCIVDGSAQSLALVRVITVIARSTNTPVLALPITELRALLTTFISAVNTETKLAEPGQKGGKSDGL